MTPEQKLKKREYLKEYRKKNLEKVKQAQREWYQRNKAIIAKRRAGNYTGEPPEYV